MILTRNISSNPLSNVSWYGKTELLKTQTSVTTTSFFIKRATCSDTQNFTLVVSNGVGSKATAVVELIVNCKLSTYFSNGCFFSAEYLNFVKETDYFLAWIKTKSSPHCRLISIYYLLMCRSWKLPIIVNYYYLFSYRNDIV